MTNIKIAFLFVTVFVSSHAFSQSNELKIIAYYSGNPEQAGNLPAEKLTHVIFSFCHLKGNKLAVDSQRDSLTIWKLVGLKQKNPNLKVILSLGGWSGCEMCSDVFSTAAARKEFSESVLALCKYFNTDGIDLDWEYPAIEGYPGHHFKPEDKPNFTALVQQLRSSLGNKLEISFAAGGFDKFLDQSIEWEPVMKAADRVNVMSYDLINGYATETGHHTALYSNPSQKESTDNAVQRMVKMGVPRNKIVIGAAFYSRIWENVEATNNGLYQAGKFKGAVDYRNFPKELSPANGFQLFWDDVTKAPYAYNSSQKLFATFDDTRSLEVKTKYVLDQKLDGIMFWEISHDSDDNQLVNAIYRIKHASTRK
jgi:chitinase